MKGKCTTLHICRINQLTSEENDKKEVSNDEVGTPPLKKIAKTSDSDPSDQ